MSKEIVHVWRADVVCMHLLYVGESTEEGKTIDTLIKGMFYGNSGKNIEKAIF